MVPAQNRRVRWLQGIARLKPGVTIEQAHAEMETIAASMAKEYPGTSKDFGTYAEPFAEIFVAQLRERLLVLGGAVAFVLLIACANVASLSLTRAVAREKELSIRAAIGAGRAPIVRQMLTESLLIALGGAAVGAMIAFGGVRLLSTYAADQMPAFTDLSPDIRVLAFGVGVVILVTVLVGLLPALRSSRLDLTRVLNESSRGSTAGGSSQTLRQGFVVAQISLALILLVGAGLMISSFLNLAGADLGFTTDRLMTMRVGAPRTTYLEHLPRLASGTNVRRLRPRLKRFIEQLAAQIQSVPGVESGGLTSALPAAEGNWQQEFRLLGVEPDEAGPTRTGYRPVTPGYFRALKIPTIQGRMITDRDIEGAPLVAVVNEAFVRQFCRGQEPIGQTLAMTEAENLGERTFEIVGVVGDVRQRPDREPEPETYISYLQQPNEFPAHIQWARVNIGLVVRASGNPKQAVSGVRALVGSLNNDLPVHSIRTMDELLDGWTSRLEFYALLLGIFAGLALVLAVVGVYGVMSYSVDRRLNEIGIRRALGALNSDVFSLVLKQAVKLTAAGVVLGVAGAFTLTRLIASELHEVEPTDPATFATVILTLAAASFLACVIPVLRAVRVDPMTTLRYE